MSYPTKYTRQFGYDSWQATHVTDPLPGYRVDDDLNAVQVSIDGIVEFLKLHSRSDGALANGSVTLDSLSSEVLVAIATGDTGGVDAGDIGFTPTGGLAATTVAAALAELDTEKLPGAVLHPGYLTGRYYPTWDGAVGSGAVAAADLLYLYPFRVTHTVTVKTLVCRVITGGAGSSVKMGIWANSPTSNRPVGAPLTGDNTGQSTSSSGTNPEANVADVTLAPGWYWAGSKFTGSMPTMWVAQANNPRTMALMGSTSIAALIQTGLSVSSTYSSDLPTLAEGATFTMSTAVMPLIGFST